MQSMPNCAAVQRVLGCGDAVTAAGRDVSRPRDKAVVWGPGTHLNLQNHAYRAAYFVRVREVSACAGIFASGKTRRPCNYTSVLHFADDSVCTHYVITSSRAALGERRARTPQVAVRAATANSGTSRIHHAHITHYYRTSHGSGPAAANNTKTAADNQTKPRVAVRRRLRPAARPPRDEMARDVGEQRSVDRVR